MILHRASLLGTALQWLDHGQKAFMADLEQTLADISFIITGNDPSSTNPITLPDPRFGPVSGMFI